MDDKTSQAINAALGNDWKKAVEINTQILKENCHNVDCLNRLGKALLELGENKKAAAIFRKALRIDKYNPIATKNLARTQTSSSPKKTVSKLTSDFLEEPGKTKLIALVNTASSSTLLKQKQADQVNLAPKRHTIIVTDLDDNYLGALPDDVGHRLSVLIKGGNRYLAFTKSVAKNTLIIFIKETFRAKKFANTPSFVASSADYLSFLRDETAAEGTASSSSDVDLEDEGATITDKLHDDEEPEAT